MSESEVSTTEVNMDLDIIPECGDQIDLMIEMALEIKNECPKGLNARIFKKFMDLEKLFEKGTEMDAIAGFGDQIHLMTEMQLQFLSEVAYVLTSDDEDDAAILLENEMEFKERMALMEMDDIDKDSEIIIKHLISVRSARENFLQNYPKWAAVRKDAIKKLKRISASVKLLRLTSNFLKLVGRTVLLGGPALLASFFIIPFSSSMSKIQLVCRNSLIVAASLAVLGVPFTKGIVLPYELKKAREIIEEAKISSLKMKILLYPTVDSEKDLSESMKNINEPLFEEFIIAKVKELVDKGMKIKDDHLRLDYIKRTLCVLMSNISYEMVHSFIKLVDESMIIKDPHPRFDYNKKTTLKKISGFRITAVKFILVQVGKFLLLSNTEKVPVTERAKILKPLTTEI